MLALVSDLLWVIFAIFAIPAAFVICVLLYGLVQHLIGQHALSVEGLTRAERKRIAKGAGLGVDELARRLDEDATRLRAFTPRYSEVHHRKRSGGTRLIHAPDSSTKQLQRRILRRLLSRLRAHDAATGFERGKSIVHNALPHVGQAVVIRLDLVDFFRNTKAERVKRYFQVVGWSADAAELLTRLTTHQGGLPQGAPTSPRLANLVNFYLDVQLESLAKRRRGRYTRYADDLTLSFPKDYPRRMRGVVQAVRKLVKIRGYELHPGKTAMRRRHRQQRVTGLVVNDRVNLPRRQRRLLRAAEHRLRTGRTPTLSAEQLAGWQSLRSMVERQRDRGR